MQTATRPQRRLPARVYWVRRVVVFGSAFLLVFALVKLLSGGGSTDPEPQARAEIVNAEPTSSATPGARVSKAPRVRATEAATAKPRKASKRPFAEPTGPCDPSDLTLRSTVERQAADGRIEIPFVVEGTEPACTWRASNRSMVVRISSGNDPIWSSQECAKLSSKDMVVRAAKPGEVVFVWNGRRSDDNCSRTAKWALPGYYHVTSAALGGEPSDQQFELVAPSPEKIYETVTPKPRPKKSGKASSSASPSPSAG